MASQVNLAELFDHLKEQVINLAELMLQKYKEEAKQDALLFLERTKEKLARWTIMLNDNDLDTQEFEWLVNSQKQLLEMEALKQAGLAAIRIDQFKNSVMNIVVDTVFSFLKI